MRLLAQCFNVSGQQLCGPLILPGGNSQPKLADIVNLGIIIVVPLAAIILFFVLVWGGFDFMFSQGDPGKIKSARAKITSALIGFALLLIAFLLIRIIDSILHLSGGLF